MSELNGTAIGRRLRQRLSAAKISQRGLTEAIEERIGAVRGVSYSGIRTLVKGEIRHPRREVVEAAAAALGVRTEWLIEGVEPVTATEVALGSSPDADLQRVRDAAEGGLPVLRLLPGSLRHQAGELIARIANDRRWPGDDPSIDHVREAADYVYRAYLAVLELEPGDDGPTGVVPASERFLRAFFHALELARDVPRARRSEVEAMEDEIGPISVSRRTQSGHSST